MKKRLLISFSGGRTSAMMTKLLWDELPHDEYDIQVVFANTGQEHEATLQFANNVETVWGIPIVWVEADVQFDRRSASKHKVVDYKTACRNGRLFMDMSIKYGIPNKSFPHCTRELKLNPIRSYIKSIGWKRSSYDTAIGIRIDEIDRMDEKAKEKRIIYPLVKRQITKVMVNEWFKEQPFNLNIPEHFGNCTWCWKKSLRKLLTNAKYNPEFFDVPQILEDHYSRFGPIHKRDPNAEPHRLFRNNMSTRELIELAKRPFYEFTDEMRKDLDLAGACSESCEVNF